MLNRISFNYRIIVPLLIQMFISDVYANSDYTINALYFMAFMSTCSILFYIYTIIVYPISKTDRFLQILLLFIFLILGLIYRADYNCLLPLTFSILNILITLFIAFFKKNI